jgi:hypothetical protein
MEALRCYKQNIMGDSEGSSEDQNVNGNVDSEGRFMRFQMVRRTLLENGLEAIHATFWTRICLHFVPVL